MLIDKQYITSYSNASIVAQYLLDILHYAVLACFGRGAVFLYSVFPPTRVYGALYFFFPAVFSMIHQTVFSLVSTLPFAIGQVQVSRFSTQHSQHAFFFFQCVSFLL